MAGTKGRSGRKPKPHGLKVLHGTVKPGDEPEVEFPEADTDAPPYWVTDEHALREWDNLFPLLSDTRIMTEADRTMLGHLCNLHSEIVKCYLVAQVPSGSKLARLQGMYAEFGLTPASRGRVKATGDGKAKNPFAGLKTG